MAPPSDSAPPHEEEDAEEPPKRGGRKPSNTAPARLGMWGDEEERPPHELDYDSDEDKFLKVIQKSRLGCSPHSSTEACFGCRTQAWLGGGLHAIAVVYTSWLRLCTA